VLHGGGDSTRENVWFFADFLARAGIASFVYDKRGNGASTGDWRVVGFEPRAGDVVQSVAELRRHPDVDSTRMGLLAVSQGSWVGGLAAARDPGIAFVIHVSGPAVSVVEADTYATLSELRREQWPPDAIAERLHLWRLSTEVTRALDSDAPWTALQAAVDSVRGRPWFQADPYQPSREGWFRPWYRQVLDYDPLPTLQRLDIPMLWIYGERDSESDPIHNIAILTQLRREQGKPYQVEVFPAAGHGLVGPVDDLGNTLALPGIAPGYLELLVSWITERGRR
jgi:pimeloyl-ACP methyl ester carboxylesterase